MNVFVDNDIILKLAACNLFSEAITSFEFKQSNLRVLSNAKYVFRGRGKVKQQYPSAIRDRAIAIVETCRTIQANLSDELAILLQVEAIDEGEAILISATCQQNYFYLVTGDKRCLEALARNDEIREIHQSLQGKCICLEQIILNLIYTQGFEKISEKVLPARQYDTALRSIFGSGEEATQDNVLQSLQGYINDLQNKSNGLLVDLDRISC
ncbi:MAG: hypothetical protein SWY16_13310 [Cyanobacteriota bacterium]|nr:hypothetical protein [Cyanobacteriota bacterium]